MLVVIWCGEAIYHSLSRVGVSDSAIPGYPKCLNTHTHRLTESLTD